MKIQCALLILVLAIITIEAGTRRDKKAKTKNKNKGNKNGTELVNYCPTDEEDFRFHEFETTCCLNDTWYWPTGGPIYHYRVAPKGGLRRQRCNSGSQVFVVESPTKCGCVDKNICPEDGHPAYGEMTRCCKRNIWKWPGPGRAYFAHSIMDENRDERKRNCDEGYEFVVRGHHMCGCEPAPKKPSEVRPAGTGEGTFSKPKCPPNSPLLKAKLWTDEIPTKGLFNVFGVCRSGGELTENCARENQGDHNLAKVICRANDACGDHDCTGAEMGWVNGALSAPGKNSLSIKFECQGTEDDLDECPMDPLGTQCRQAGGFNHVICPGRRGKN